MNAQINASDANGSWWFGRKVRDLNTGAVTTEYERYKVTGLSGTVSASKLDFSLNFGDSPTRFNGKRSSN